jgi:histidinol-phosphate aminotransferase
MGIDELARVGLGGAAPAKYPSPEEGFLRMDANTNLLGNNPVVERVAREIAKIELNHYPSAFGDALREAIAVTHKVPIDGVILGNGSDEILDFIAKAFLNPGDAVALAAPSFVMQKFYAVVNLGRPVEVPLRAPGFELDVEGMLGVGAKLTMVASPNNPTANRFEPADLEAIAARSRGIVVIDEAYAEFCDQNWLARAPAAERLIVVRTFSKAYGLAGMRIGYAVANPKIVSRLHAVKPPFSVNLLGERMAVEALRDTTYLRESVRLVREQRELVAGRLKEMGLAPCRSDANFLLIDLGRPSAPIRHELRKRGILVRDMGDFPGLENHLRVTVGRPEHNAAFLAALGEALGR